MKSCSKCKIEKEDSDFYFDKVKQKLSSWCKECRKWATRRYGHLNRPKLSIARKKYRRTHLEKFAAWNRKFHGTPKGKFSIYKNTAKERGINFELRYEDFLKFFDKDCHYCGEKILDCGGVGIDRVDNTKGYTLDNTVPCCRPCNIAKLTYTAEEYIERCIKVAERHGVKNV